MTTIHATEIDELGRRFNPYRDPYHANPYPFFEEARRAAPVFYSPEVDGWVVTRYEDMRRIFQNPKTFSASNTLDLKPVCPMALQTYAAANFNTVPTLTITDPPAHPRIRRLANMAFSKEKAESLEPYIRSLMSKFFEKHGSSGHVELVRDLAWDIPALVMFRLIGAPEKDLPMLYAATRHPKLVLWGRPTDNEQIHVAEGMATFWKYIVQVVAKRAKKPEDDFASALLHARAGELEPFSEAEVASVMFGVLVAGHETTTSLIAHSVLRLLSDRASWDSVVREPDLIPNAVEEILRMDSSVIGWRRRTTEAVEIGGVHVPAGVNVLMLLGSANHDPAVFENPEQFDIRRPNAKSHLSFGLGNHLCIGATLARLQARVAIHELSQNLPSLRLVPNQKVRYHTGILFRGPLALEVEWDVM